jgi:hypothetical protein
LSIEAAKEIIAKLDVQLSDRPLGNPYFKDPDVTAFPFRKESFFAVRPVKSGRQLAFIDGGNLELLGAPNFSVQLNRIYACVWKDNSRKNILKVPLVEFFSAIYSIMQGDDIIFNAIIVPTSAEFSRFLPDPTDLIVRYSERPTNDTVATVRMDTSRVASIARNFAEWCFAEKLVPFLDTDDVIVMDGSLQTQFQNEWKYFRNLEDATKKQGVILTSLSKTSTLLTDTGLSLLGAISQFASDAGIGGEWYHPIFESHKHHVAGVVVKLKSASEWVFRLDFQLDQFKRLDADRINEILSLFCSNSSDPTFPGYPFGSIDADSFSRVSKDEIDYYRALISSQISALNKQGRFVPHIRAGDAHNLLNTLSGY